MIALSMECAIAIFLRGSVLLAAALAASWLFGRRWPSGVSAWHRAMIVGLLALPCGAVFMPRLPVPWLPAHATERIARTAPVLPPAIRPVRGFLAREPAGEKELSSNSPAHAASGSSAPTASADAPPPVESRQERAASANRYAVSWETLSVVGIAAIYVAGVAFGLLRFALGFRQAARLHRDCTAADPAWQAASARWSQTLGVRCEVPVMVTDRLPVPATLGWLRPLILIPRRLDVTDLTEQRDAVLLHELAHVARRDAFWQSLARLTGVIYWCHPLMWVVGREIEAAWDAACDSVCAFHLGVASYSRSLSDLAQGLVARRLPLVGLCMARSSRLAGRLRRLKDSPNGGECRPRLAKRAVLWAVGLSAALLAAVVTPVERSAVAQTPAAVTKESSKPATRRALVVSGVVLDEDGSPLGDAKLLIRSLNYWELRDPHHQTSYVYTKLKEWKLATDSSGAFRFEPGKRPDVGLVQVQVTVTARGRLQFQKTYVWQDLAKGKLAKFRLPRGRVVTGRVLSPDGRPVEGASIQASSYYRRRFDWEPENGSLDIDRKTRWLWYWPRAVKSDANGRFEVALPVETYGELCVDARDWAPERVAVEANAKQVGDVKLTEGWQLSGKLVNRKGQPVAGQIVVIQSRDGGKVPGQSATLSRCDKTDSAGRFKLLPARGLFSVSLMPMWWDSAGDEPELLADGPLLLLAPTVVQLDGSDPAPKIVLREPETVSLSGHIAFEDGRPAEGVEFNVFAACPSVTGGEEPPANGRTYYELAAGRSDKQGRYTMSVPRNISPHIGALGQCGANHTYYQAWPQPMPNAVQLQMGNMTLTNVTEDVGNLNWVLKPDKERPARRRAVSRTPPPQPGDEVLAKLESEIDAVSKRGEDPRLTMLERCFEVEKENRGSRAAIGALHFVMRAGATTSQQSVSDGWERASKLLREHYLGHRDLDLLIDEFTAGYGGLAESEALLRAARKDSPHPHVRAAAGLYLAELLQHRARMNEAFGKMDLAEYDKLKIGVTDEKGNTQTVEVKVADMDEAGRKHFKEQRNQVAQLQKLLAHFDERANERAIVALLDDVIEHYAGVKGPRYCWDWSNYPRRDLRFIRPVPDDEPGNSPDYSAHAAKLRFQVTQLKLGHPAPDIVGKDPQGKPVKLSDERGRVVVLTVGSDFEENDVAIKRCHELLEKHGNAPLAMVSVVEEQPNQPYSAYNRARGAGITWKVIADPDGVLCAKWCQITFPEVYVIDAEGILRFHGMCGEYSEDFTPLVEELLKKAESSKRP